MAVSNRSCEATTEENINVFSKEPFGIKKMQDAYIAKLEDYWEPHGFIGQLRDGVYDPVGGVEFVFFLEAIELDADCMMKKRLVELLWFLPTFMDWQVDRVVENGTPRIEYTNYYHRVLGVLQNVLGGP